MVFIFVDIDVVESACNSIHDSVSRVLLYDDLFSLKMTVITLVHFLLDDLHLIMGLSLLIVLNFLLSYTVLKF